MMQVQQAKLIKDYFKNTGLVENIMKDLGIDHITVDDATGNMLIYLGKCIAESRMIDNALAKHYDINAESLTNDDLISALDVLDSERFAK